MPPYRDEPRGPDALSELADLSLPRAATPSQLALRLVGCGLGARSWRSRGLPCLGLVTELPFTKPPGLGLSARRGLEVRCDAELVWFDDGGRGGS